MQYFDIILFAVIAGVLAVRLYRILGIKSKVILDNKESASKKITNIKKKEEPPLDSFEIENGEGLEYLNKVYPEFNKDSFISGSKKALEMILNAKHNGDKKLLISFLEDDVFRLFEKSILDADQKGHSVEKISMQIREANINEIKIHNNIALIRVSFDYTEGLLINNSDGSIFSDNSNAPSSYNVNWTFSRPLASDSPNWKLFAADQIP